MKETIRYGIVGYSKDHFDKNIAYGILNTVFQEIKDSNPKTIIEIVSGYTNSGIPKIAYELSKEYGFLTVGFSAQQALQVKSGTYPVDKVIIVGEKFGDESEAFVKYIDKLIRIGGGQQSRHETVLFKGYNSGKSLSTILKEFEIDSFIKHPK